MSNAANNMQKKAFGLGLVLWVIRKIENCFFIFKRNNEIEVTWLFNYTEGPVILFIVPLRQSETIEFRGNSIFCETNSYFLNEFFSVTLTGFSFGIGKWIRARRQAALTVTIFGLIWFSWLSMLSIWINFFVVKKESQYAVSINT